MAWLLGIARNQLRMEWRRTRMWKLISLEWLPPGVEACLPGMRRSDATRACHERDGIQRALDAISPTLREALLLHTLCGFTGGEVAGILGITPEAARKRIVRADAEFRLLRYLMLNRDRVVSKTRILDHAWDYEYMGDPSAVETYISYLRRKLDDRDNRLIRTVRGVGYSLRGPETEPGDS